MKKLYILIWLCFTADLLSAYVSKTVNVTDGGNLFSSFTTIDKATVTNLTVTGSIDARDFKFMRDTLSVLSVLDLSGVSITAYTGTGGSSSESSSKYLANEVPERAFYNSYTFTGKSSLTSVLLPTTLISIGNSAFYDCTGLRSIAIPSSVTTIVGNAFQFCSGLNSITIPTSVNSIGSYAFSNCTGLTSVSIPPQVTIIEICTFSDCTGLTSVTIPASVTTIETGAFSNCTGLSSITIPVSVIFINPGAFYKCNSLILVAESNPVYSSLDGILFNKNQTSIIHYPYVKKGSYSIPTSVTSIGVDAFRSCTDLTSVIIPTSVNAIGYGSFRFCTSLTSVTIPSSVTSIGGSAVAYCSGLSSIYAYSTTPVSLASSPSVFINVNKATCVLHLLVGSKAAYQAAEQWKDFTNIMEMTTAVPMLNDESISLYPNPVSDALYISGISNVASLKIFDMNGKLLLNCQVTNNESVSISSLPKGFYIVKLITEEGIVERKTVKK